MGVRERVANAYDAAAGQYDTWHWSAFWQDREVPVAAGMLRQCARGLLVDAGCGTGRYRAVARSLGFPYLGVDISPQMLSAGALRLGKSGYGDALLEGDLRSTGLPANSAAVIVCARTICHLPDPAAAFAEFARITTGGGALILTDLDPMFRVPSTRLPTLNGKVDVPTFRRSPEELVAAAQPFGFTLVDRVDLGSSSGAPSFVLRMRRQR